MRHPLRLPRISDRESMRTIALTSGLFEAGEEALVMDAFDDHIQNSGASGEIWIVAGDTSPVGAAYCAPQPDGDRVWNLLFIAVAPEGRRQGTGRLLVESVVDTARQRAGRILLVETSDSPDQSPARDLYRHCEFVEVATVPDYYSDGVGKVVFSRRLG